MTHPTAALLLSLALAPQLTGCREAAPAVGHPAPDGDAAALLMRELYRPGPGERTGNRRERIDADGCYRAQANSFRWVEDPLVSGSTAPLAHWSDPWPGAPDFCLAGDGLARLRAGVGRVGAGMDPGQGCHQGSWTGGAVERWTLWIDGQPRTLCDDPHAASAAGRALQALLADAAAAGAWGCSPEARGPGADGPTINTMGS